MAAKICLPPDGAPIRSYTVDEAYHALQVSRSQLYRFMETGAMKFFSIGRRGRRIAEGDLHEFINRRRQVYRLAAGAAAR